MQPCILLPEDWGERFNEGSLRHVLLHELLHIKNHDLIWNWASVAVQALHWFNPLVWLVVMDYENTEFDNSDFQDNIYLVSNMRPANQAPAPTDVRAVNTTSGSVNIQWAGVSDAGLINVAR